MAVSIVVPQFFLPQGSVKLGRFITRIDHPHQRYHDPPSADPPKPIVSQRESYVGLQQKGSDASFASTLTSLMSAGFSKRAKTQVRVSAEQVTTYTLDSSDDWFEGAMRLSSTRTWIERAVDTDEKIYMVVGFHVIKNARVINEYVREKGVEGQIKVPVSLAVVGGISPLGEFTDPSIGGSGHNLDNTQSSFVAAGERICAFQYREIRHRLLSSKSIDKLQPSKSPRWSRVELRRAEEDEEGEEDEAEDDVIEVEAALVDEPGLGGKWDKEKLPNGGTVLLRAYEA